ncbi:uncharacterized protein METZ01_LOCUS309197, partial [marine metagenome]
MKTTPTASLFVALSLLGLTGATAQQATSSEARMRSWNQHVQMAKDSPFRDLEWRAIGPKQAGARVEAIAVPSGSHGTIYAGIGSGNLWKTTNNGITWTPIFENESTFTIGDVAVAPSNPDIVWVGTGETQPRHSGYSFSGTGVFKSENAGETWHNMGLQDTHHVGKVIIDPNNPEIVYVGAIGHFWSPNEERGVFKTTDGGQTWRKTLYVSERTGVVEMAIDPSNSDILYAATWQAVSGTPHEGGPESGIHKSINAGETWTKLTNGLPSGPLGRIGLDVAFSDPNIVYAFVDNRNVPAPPDAIPGESESNESPREIIGGEIYRSNDKGSTWFKANVDDTYGFF